MSVIDIFKRCLCFHDFKKVHEGEAVYRKGTREEIRFKHVIVKRCTKCRKEIDILEASERKGVEFI